MSSWCGPCASGSGHCRRARSRCGGSRPARPGASCRGCASTTPRRTATGGPPMTATERWGRTWRYAQVLVAPLALWVLLGSYLLWFNNDDRYDRAALQEWLEEARNPDSTLPELAQQYAERAQAYAILRKQGGQAVPPDLFVKLSTARTRADTKRVEVREHLRTLGEPATKMYPGLLLLFPAIYRLEV